MVSILNISISLMVKMVVKIVIMASEAMPPHLLLTSGFLLKRRSLLSGKRLKC